MSAIFRLQALLSTFTKAADGERLTTYFGAVVVRDDEREREEEVWMFQRASMALLNDLLLWSIYSHDRVEFHFRASDAEGLDRVASQIPVGPLEVMEKVLSQPSRSARRS